MNFLDLHERLRLVTWRRIDQGLLSSSLLARQTGLAQAHISNFLHRRRRLSLPALDRILLAQALTVEELSARDLSISPPPHAAPPEGNERDSMDTVPIVSHAVAMNSPVIAPRAVLDSLQLPSGWLSSFPVRRAVSRRLWDRFVAVRVTAPQALPMQPLLTPGAIAVIDRHYSSLAHFRPSRPNLYAVRSGSQLLFRHVAFDSNRLLLRPRDLDLPVDLIELAAQEFPSDFLIGRVCLSICET